MSRLEERQKAWMPDGITLEPAALAATKSAKHTLVVAGPGAGKTELLAQRACYLLQTGTCPGPYRILAISFKRDAAENLKARVNLRCGRELASRLDSMTYDAFAKDLLDRFRLALPVEVRPSPDYDIVTGANVADERMRQRMQQLSQAHCELSTHIRQQITGAQLRVGMTANRLPFADWPRAPHFVAGAGLWRGMLADSPSHLTFVMVNRLAEYLVRADPTICAALRDTYRFVFLDEFQDTTAGQCELTETCFHSSASILTSVGDSKQRIMGWAGALPGIFKRFKDTFGADVVPLMQNHRSRSRLVEIQSVFAAELDPEAVKVESARPGSETGECRVLEFKNQVNEAQHLARLIAELVEEGTPPQEICVLCRAQPDKFAKALIDDLKAAGIKVRVEVNRREILGEPVSALLIAMIALVFSNSAPDAWEHVSAIVSELAGDTDEVGATRTCRKLLTFLAEQRALLVASDGSQEDLHKHLDRLLDFAGRDRFAALHPQYAQGDYLTEVMERLAGLIEGELPESGWDGLVDAVQGVGAVSVMTMHKSKGLEFDTVIFLGLEDGAIWNYQRNSEEETCGLFVALSRAKESCIFTYCRARVNRFGNLEAQTRVTIKRVYDLFRAADVTLERID